ncbi:MAG: c-type cytochrome [Pararhodobacter sp.]
MSRANLCLILAGVLLAASATAQETQTQVLPVEQAPAQEAPVQETPTQEIPVQTAPAEEALEQEAPAQEAPAQPPAAAVDIDALLSRFSTDPDHLTHTDGEALYQTTCQACHMEDGTGAAGAGAHPPLTGNPKLTSRHFLAGVILTGYHGMPRFGHMMSDEQVAAVTNYVRSHFGNAYPDAITPEEVARLRPPDQDD